MIDVVFVGNIATSGIEAVDRELKAPHRLRAYPCDLADAEVLVGSPISRRMIEQASGCAGSRSARLRQHRHGRVERLRRGVQTCSITSAPWRST